MAFIKLESIPKTRNIGMPLRLYVQKVHKEMIINRLKLVIFCVFVTLWLKYTFKSGLKLKRFTTNFIS